MLKNRDNYEIFRPEDVGAGGTQIVLTARSGRHAVRHRLEELGYKVSPRNSSSLHVRFLALADAKKQVFDDNLHALMSRRRTEATSRTSRSRGCASSPASARLPVRDYPSRRPRRSVEKCCAGDGPVDACFRAVDEITGIPVTLREYHLNAATAEKAALGEAQVVLELGGRRRRAEAQART